MKDRKVLYEEKWRNETQSVSCFTLDAVDPGYLARRPHCILSFPRECRHFYVQEKQSSRETGAQNQLEHTHPPLASFSSPCPSPESKMSCWGESSILIYFIFFLNIKPYSHDNQPASVFWVPGLLNVLRQGLLILFPFFVPSKLCCWGLGATAFWRLKGKNGLVELLVMLIS